MPLLHPARLLGAVGLALAAFGGGSAAAGPTPERVYSDSCRTPDSDDVAGHRVEITGPMKAPHVDYFWSDGQMHGPVEAREVRYSAKARTLSFRADTPSGAATFKGRITSAALVGELKEGWEASSSAVHLRRRHAPGDLRSCAPLTPRHS